MRPRFSNAGRPMGESGKGGKVCAKTKSESETLPSHLEGQGEVRKRTFSLWHSSTAGDRGRTSSWVWSVVVALALSVLAMRDFFRVEGFGFSPLRPEGWGEQSGSYWPVDTGRRCSVGGGLVDGGMGLNRVRSAGGRPPHPNPPPRWGEGTGMPVSLAEWMFCSLPVRVLFPLPWTAGWGGGEAIGQRAPRRWTAGGTLLDRLMVEAREVRRRGVLSPTFPHAGGTGTGPGGVMGLERRWDSRAILCRRCTSSSTVPSPALGEGTVQVHPEVFRRCATPRWGRGTGNGLFGVTRPGEFRADTPPWLAGSGDAWNAVIS